MLTNKYGKQLVNYIFYAVNYTFYIVYRLMLTFNSLSVTKSFIFSVIFE